MYGWHGSLSKIQSWNVVIGNVKRNLDRVMSLHGPPNYYLAHAGRVEGLISELELENRIKQCLFAPGTHAPN
jgi:hypothetical protein